MSKVAFVGVGRMGANMARHLQLDCGHDVTAIFDVNKEVSAEIATELGAKDCATLAEVTEAAEIIFTVVTNDNAMRAIFLGEGDNLLTDSKEKTFVNCATLSPGIHKEVYAAGKGAGADVLEGAMASSISQAREGKLFLMIGGDESVFNAHKEILEQLSVNLSLCGPIGKAAEVKALVNMVMNINTAGLAEGLGLADALGLDLKVVCDIFSQTGANSRVLETDAEDMIDRDHECWFSAEHAAKDSGIAGDIAKELGLSLPVNDATKAQYDKMVTSGLGELDKSGIAELTFKGRGPQAHSGNC
ncbi:NAD(P)-dependent oxidoreductase [Akkermansiaceae bacterium]|nr:NAD(P)-dependent oxidoreductase [Akkermansiaceae bacterium]MDB4274760.1 NAD(P)-dependent oxidoreductase [Akkermansiaceae bacterium]MDB4467587.1 NAD(P)-dependent oxidoreductase [Akkermansiaceae bacterium]MDB4569925.1 NAD(P)-dependent oxidoreductase [Akkermansiaceae bacterium]